MCNFLSAIVLSNGDVLTAPEYTDSHEDLILHFGLENCDNSRCQHFVRVEFTPEKIDDPDSYTLKIDDEGGAPQWFGEHESRIALPIAG